MPPRDARSPAPSASADRREPALSTVALLSKAIDRLVASQLWWGFALVAAVSTAGTLLGAQIPHPLRYYVHGYLPIISFSVEEVSTTIALVERSAAFVSCVGFTSFLIQMDGLIGSRGIAPAAEIIRRRKLTVQWESASWTARRAAFHRMPTFFWMLDTSDRALRGVCLAGLCASAGLTVLGGAYAYASPDEEAPPSGRILLASVAWAVAYACHLSLIAVSGDFLGLQSDSNLCELCAVCSLCSLLRGGDADAPAAALSVLRWLAARKMLGCGLCKHFGSPMWRDRTAMSVHYWTQPLPNPLSRWAHRLPPSCHQASVLGTFLVEIALPVASFVGVRPLRLLACACFLGINAAINLTGNYGFIGLLSVVESSALLDDAALHDLAHAARRLASALPVLHRLASLDVATDAACEAAAAAASVAASAAGADATGGFAGGYVSPGWLALTVWSLLGGLLRLLVALALCAYVLASLPPLSQAARHCVDAPMLLQPAERLYERLRKYRLVNYYAKFASMHCFRWELLLEGSDDGTTWHAYGWRYKPCDARKVPPWVPLHLPRLDWRVWFLPLGCRRQGAQYEPPAWLRRLLDAIVRHEPTVLRLLDRRTNPFPHRPPRYGMRTRLAAFRFPAPGSAADGAHWEVEELPRKSGRLDTSSLCLEVRTP